MNAAEGPSGAHLPRRGGAARRILRAVLVTLAWIVGLPLAALALLAIAFALLPDAAVEAREGDAIGGVFHVHAAHSHDGFGTLEEAAAAAEEAGARFLVLTEHNAIHPPAPMRLGGVLVVPGVEISADAGHVIALGAAEVPPKEERGAGVHHAVAARGGETVLAHPVNLRRPWSDPSPDGFAGFEVLSLDSSFREAKANAPWRLGLALGALLGAPDWTGALLVERPDDAFARYDAIAARRDLALVCGVDAHGLPPYRASFGALRLFLPATAGWGADPRADAEAIRSAIREARTFCAVPALGDASSFRFEADEGGVEAAVEAEGVTIALFRDGVEVARLPGPRLQVPAAAGVWRAEVLIDDPGFPWRAGALWIASSARRIGPAPGPRR